MNSIKRVCKFAVVLQKEDSGAACTQELSRVKTGPFISWVNSEGSRREGLGDGNMRDQEDSVGEGMEKGEQ